MTYSLYELNEYIRQVLALNFSEALWVRCELGQVKQSRGHYYLDLVQKSEDGEQIMAQSQGVIWALQWRNLKNKLGLELEVLLQEGIEVLLLVKIEYHERFGLKLMVQDIDPAYTLGKLALKRRETLQRLKEEGLLELNGELELPTVIQRIAIFSSEQAAGLKDFLNEMGNNEFGYAFQFNLFPVAMQGAKVTEEFTAALKKLRPKDYDALVIIRGGGSKLDLVAFDDYELCQQIAKVPLPVICGIGHEIDETVLDRVAHSSLKTPTAVAGFILHRNMLFESEIMQLATNVKNESSRLVQEHLSALQQYMQSIVHHSEQLVRKEEMMIGFIARELPVMLKNRLQREKANLELLEKSANYLGPEMTLKRGFTITLKDGTPVTDQSQLSPGDEIETFFPKTKIISTVK